MTRPVLVPELLVTDLDASLRFWRDICGFAVLYDRPEDGFACIERDGARLMLDRLGTTRDWVAAPLERPFGRGMNLEIAVDAVDPLLSACAAAGWPLFLAAEEKSYRIGAAAARVRQFIVQDPDGYLVRFSQRLAG
ncbi:bleomycin resistance protein [Roseomonas fluvialis]|uniref:Bleomycin resistance protein n=1 Tax=Roseomonas fluvialis TaxID=1750527 RepID=A0ABN6NZJ6_9PROT|nr:VOC family protein [Roseomonas fluvialis]BDG71466.1 aldoketomutase [Roseomonas fluvialis]